MSEGDPIKMLPHHLLVAFELHLISPKQVIELADQMIAKCTAPPGWLIDLACSQAKFRNIHEWLRQLGLPEKTDDATFLGLMAAAFFNETLSLEKISSLLFDQICLTDWKEMTNLRQQVYLLDDEMDWDKTKARKTCEGILRPHLQNGAKLLDAIHYLERCP